jgi:RimJ/RimL family protein N-acetyltransferase
MKILLIETEKLRIRNLVPEDLVIFHQYRSNAEVMKYQGMDVMDLAKAEAFIENQKDKLFGKPGEWVQYAIADKLTDNLLGDCAIKLDAHEPRIAEIGITIAPENQRKGYAKQAFTGILTFLFNKENVHRVVELVAAKNVASIQLLHSMGFKKEGYFRESYFDNGQWESEFQYALLKKK